MDHKQIHVFTKSNVINQFIQCVSEEGIHKTVNQARTSANAWAHISAGSGDIPLSRPVYSLLDTPTTTQIAHFNRAGVWYKFGRSEFLASLCAQLKFEWTEWMGLITLTMAWQAFQTKVFQRFTGNDANGKKKSVASSPRPEIGTRVWDSDSRHT